MQISAKKVLTLAKRGLQVVLVLVGGYVLVLIGTVLWTFEVTLRQWPLFIYSSPSSLSVGDDINDVRLFDRLTRLGYAGNQVVAQDPGQWSESGSGLSLYLKYTPLSGHGIVYGPVGISLDWNRVRSIRLMRAMEDVNQIALEPELIHIFPARGCAPELCRAVPLEKIPSLLLDAIILTEDTHFFSHGGIDLASIHRALKTNIKAGRYVQGGSTISQQLIRMTVLSPEKTLWRKINEIMLAIGADAIYSKRTILEAYLNRIYLGHWGPFPIKGLAEAARLLFGKDLSELDPSECAFLAATIRAPNIINPYRHPERARSRRNMVLGLLFKAGKISRDVYEEALESPVRMKKPGASPVRADGFLDLVKQRLVPDFGSAGPGRQDIITSLDALLQATADLELKKIGDAGLQSHLILSIPRSGEIISFIAPGPHKWAGGGGSLESLLPLLMVPALVPEKHDQVSYTLTTHFFTAPGDPVPVTLREAFRSRRPLLVEKLSASLGSDRIVTTLKEFGINAWKQSGGIFIDSIGPMQMAHTYSLLATLGSAAAPRPGIRVVDSMSTDILSTDRRTVSFDPAILFLVNYLLKGLEPAAEKDGGPDKAWSQPSIFNARDREGIWDIVYRNDALLVIRIPGHDVKEATIRQMIPHILPPAKVGSENIPQVPGGVLFRKICVHTGLLAVSTCPRVIREPFLKGTQPREWCSYRHDPSPIRSNFRN